MGISNIINPPLDIKIIEVLRKHLQGVTIKAYQIEKSRVFLMFMKRLSANILSVTKKPEATKIGKEGNEKRRYGQLEIFNESKG
jgi:hypothetical protein